jgi:poly(3-hydroxybutyrate) depolymerase
MIDVLKRNYAVDEDRFYATGFSNGAQFTGRLAAQMSDVFAAFALCGIGRTFNQEQAASTS